MFICRHVLLRAYISRHVTTLHAARRPLLRALPLSRPRISAPASTKTPAVDETWTLQQAADPACDEHVTQPQGADGRRGTAVWADDGSLLPLWLLDQAALQTEVAREATDCRDAVAANYSDQDLVDAYLASREDGDFFRYTGNDPQRIFEVLEAAKTTQRVDAVRLLVADVVETGHFLARDLRIACIERLLVFPAEGLLSKEQALRLFESLQSFARLTTLSDATRVTVAEAMLAMPRTPEIESRLLDILATLLLDYAGRGTERTKDRTRSKALSSRAIRSMYLLAYDLADLGMHRRSLDVMQALVQAKKLSSSALEQADLNAGQFGYIVLSTLIRSATSWGWRRLSDDLIQRVLPTMESITPRIAELAIEVLRTLVADTSQKSITSAAALIVQLMERCRTPQIPQSVLQYFYEGAQRHRLAELAEQVYAVSQSDLVGREHQHTYLPPAKGSLYWFLRYLTNTQRNAHLPRVLAWQLVNENIPIIQQYRGPIIALLAEHGLATQARTLWERYAAGKERHIVVGNTTTMLRLVGLFVSLSRRSEYVVHTRRPQESAEPEPNVVDVAAAIVTRKGRAGSAADWHSRTSYPVADLTHSGKADFENGARHETFNALPQTSVVAEDESGMSGYQAADYALLEEDSHALVVDSDPKVVNEEVLAALAPGGDLLSESDLPFLSAETTEAGEGEEGSGWSTGATKSTSGDFRDFAERVFNAFRRNRVPFKHAHHWELNALARACFMLGRLGDGIAVFKQIYRLHHVPDLYDINVAIGVLAEHNPTFAVKIIDNMLERGIYPDAVTFGSIIQHAIIHGDMPLTTALIRRAHELGISDLSYKTVGTLIRAAATVSEEDGRLSPRTQLRNTTELVDSLLDAGCVPSPNMGRDCVRVALRADDPSAAFQFWQLLMKDKTEWGDEGQTVTRQMIARCVRKHYNEGLLDEVKTRTMLHELRARFYPASETKQSLVGLRGPSELDD